MEKPLVSIITITRNRANLISRAIKSVLNQTYENIEYIIVDGGSTDNTKIVVNNFKDKRLKYYYLDKGDPSLQSKFGFSKSKGEYIAMLDDDDEYLSTKIEKQVELIETLPHKYGLVYCWMSYFDDNTKNYIKIHKTELKGFVPQEVVEKPTVSGTPTFLFRRKVFLELGGGWRGDIGLVGSDWEFAARACQKYHVDFVPESLVNVYINHGATRLSDSEYDDREVKFIKFHSHFLNEFKNIFDKYPQKKNGHLYTIARSNFLLGKWKEAWMSYKRLLNNNIKIKYIILPPYCLLLRIIRNGKKN